MWVGLIGMGATSILGFTLYFDNGEGH